MYLKYEKFILQNNTLKKFKGISEFSQCRSPIPEKSNTNEVFACKKMWWKMVSRIIIIASCVLFSILISLVIAGSYNNPFYVVISSSMIPTFYPDDVVFVLLVPLDELEIGDVIVFNKIYKDLDVSWIHRVVDISKTNEVIIKTKGDGNTNSIEGIDYPITKNDYMGKVLFSIPQIGIIAKFLIPPINYVLILSITVPIFLKFRGKIFANKHEKNSRIFDDTNSKTISDPWINDMVDNPFYAIRGSV